MRFLIAIALIFLSLYSFEQEMRIGLIRQLKVRNLLLESKQGSYSVYGDSVLLGKLESLSFELHGQGVSCTYEGVKRVFSKVKIIQDDENSSISVKSISPTSKVHNYRGSIELSLESGNRIRIVNLVDMNSYLAGVIESEGGGGRHLEYYKVQALISRTYAIKNIDRHKKEGFQLCDGVHCQAYHNMMQYTPDIAKAVRETQGEVLADGKGLLVTTYFSANCGGQTCDASYVWNSSVPYLESFRDTFCVTTKQAFWTQSIGRYAWKSFLEKEYGITERDYGELIYNFEQNQRKAFYIHPSLGIPLRDLREKFGLKSTYFSSHLEGDNVVLEGRGFGHGVGLCQEGAMNMAKSGYTYRQIAHFYFSHVNIVQYAGQ